MEPPRTPRTPERALPNDDNDEQDHQTQHGSALWETLTRELDDPRTLTGDLANQISGPIQIDGLAESSLYWVREQETDKPCVLRFPALLDICGMYGQTGTYLNQQNARNQSQIPVKSLHQIKPIFELAKLPREEEDLNGNPLYPPDAVKCSERMFNFLHICTHKLESERNKGSHERPVPHGFFRNYRDQNGLRKSTFIVSSPPLFIEIKDASTVEDISDLEIQWDEQKMSDLLNDQRLTQTFSAKSQKGNASSQAGTEPELTLDSLDDPNGRYSTLKKEGYGSTRLIVPQVFGHNDQLILPMEYGSKFNDKTPVVVDVELRVWEFLPRSSGASGSPIKQKIQANKHGSRRYQLVLKSLKLLTPCAPDSPRKRKLDRGTLDQWRSPRVPDSPSPFESPSKRARH